MTEFLGYTLDALAVVFSWQGALALVISKIAKCRISRAYLLTDLTVLTLSLSYIPFSKIIYSFITVTLSSRIIDKIQDI